MESLLKTKTSSSISLLNKRGNAGNGLSGKFHNLRARESVSLMHDIAISNKKAKWHNSFLPIAISRVKISIFNANQIWSDDIAK